jgi:TolA-binding protein
MSGEGTKLSKEELREDEFVEWMMGAVDYVRERYQLFAFGLVVVVAALLGVDYILDSQEAARSKAATLLGQALMDEGGSSAEAMLVIQDLVDTSGGTPAAGQALLMLANRHYQDGDYGTARELYRRYLDDYGNVPVLVYAAESGIAAALVAEGQHEQAAKEYRRLAAEGAGTLQGAMALWESAKCYQRLGQTDQRRQALEELVNDHPRLPLATKARAALATL